MEVFNLRLNNRRLVLSVFLAGTLIGASASVAFAATATSNPYNYGPVNGYSYYNEASVSSDSGLVEANTSASNVSPVNVPTGYIGVAEALFNSSNQVITTRDWIYNNIPAVGIGYSTSGISTSGTYYSKGYSQAFNGSGYTMYNTNRSPNINY
jgi:hypothetical protein